MTTVATDGKSMAGDGRGVVNGTIVDDRGVKVRRLGNGELLGTSGTAGDADVFAEWYEGGCEGERPEVESDFGALVLSRRGAMTCGKSRRLAPVDVPAAIGSGMDLAMGAMAAGASPEQAVRIAAKYDLSTGGKITVLKL